MGDAQDGREQAEDALASGKAARVFGEMVREQGGPADFMNQAADYLEIASVEGVVELPDGHVASMDARAIGNAVIVLGGGRTDPAQEIDHSVGLVDIKGVGESVGADQPFCRIFGRDQQTLESAAGMIRNAVTVTAERPVPGPVTARIIRG